MRKISIMFEKAKTSISLEPEFATFLERHAALANISFAQVARDARAAFADGNLSSALRRHALAISVAETAQLRLASGAPTG